MNRVNLPKIYFYASIATSIAACIFIYGVLTGTYQIFPYEILSQTKASVLQIYRERFTLAKIKPVEWLAPARYEGSGVTINNTQKDQQEFVLLQGFFGENPGLQLIERDGTPLASWRLSYSELAANITHLRQEPATDWNVNSHGAVMLPDGSVVFNIDHIGLFKLDRCSNLVWSLDTPTHHSIEPNPDGSFWVPSSNNFYAEMESPYPPFRTPFTEDTLMLVSAEGEVLEEISLFEVFIDSNEIGLLTLIGGNYPGAIVNVRPDLNKEIFHLNDVEELPADIAGDFPMFAAGDLLVSLRNRNLVMVIGRDTRRIKWWQIGPWVRQHDPDWKAGGTITAFDNNSDGTLTGDVLGSSRIVEIDPATSESRLVYGGPGEEFFYTLRAGKHQNLNGSRVLVTEAEGSRAFEIDSDKKIIWEYVNRYNATESARIMEARAYDADFFSVVDWTCPEK